MVFTGEDLASLLRKDVKNGQILNTHTPINSAGLVVMDRRDKTYFMIQIYDAETKGGCFTVKSGWYERGKFENGKIIPDGGGAIGEGYPTTELKFKIYDQEHQRLYHVEALEPDLFRRKLPSDNIIR